jgi:hypothetical protein
MPFFIKRTRAMSLLFTIKMQSGSWRSRTIAKGEEKHKTKRKKQSHGGLQLQWKKHQESALK